MASRKTIAATAFAAALATGGLIGATLGNPLTSGADPAATTTASTTVPAGPSGAGPDGHRDGPRGFMDLTAAAKVLKMSEADLRTALQSGKSLADIAKDQGVDRQDVIDALVADAEKKIDEMKADLPSRIADLVDGKMPAGGPGRGGMDHHGPGMGGRHGEHLAAAAKVLGLSDADLRTALESGKSLADIAEDQGVDKQKVVDALVASEKDELAQAVKDGKLTQAEADTRSADIATRVADMVDGKMPARGPGMGGMHHDGPDMDGPGGN